MKVTENSGLDPRLALQRIVMLQKKNILEVDIYNHSDFDIAKKLPKDTYADPEIVKFLLSWAEKGKTVGLITDDIPLRIEVGTLLSRIPQCPKYVVDSGAELVEEYCRT